MPGRPLAAIVDDEPSIQRAVRAVLEREQIDVVTFPDAETFLAQVALHPLDLVFLDIGLPGMSGLEMLPKLKAIAPKLPVIVITGSADLDNAVQAVREGAFEFLSKPLELEQLRTVTRHGLALHAASRRAVDQAQVHRVTSSPLVGRHRSMLLVYKMIGIASAPGNKSTVLITGETGVGKNVIARAIHDRGAARTSPFLTVQCSGLPESLLENELFGHERGAFTGATTRYLGRVEQAGSGSLMLDEISEIVPSIQLKLLRLLEGGEFERLGGGQALTSHCRFISATNRDLAELVSKGQFREDLFYRLKVLEIHVPPLRERAEDLPLLVNYFVDRLSRRAGRPFTITPSSMDLLCGHDFPGNVRELAHLIEHAGAVARSDVLLPEDFPAIFRPMPAAAPLEPARAEPGPTGAGATGIPIVSENLVEARRHINTLFEQQFVTKILADHGGNVTQAAEAAGVRRQYLQRLMRKYGLESGGAGVASPESGPLAGHDAECACAECAPVHDELPDERADPLPA